MKFAGEHKNILITFVYVNSLTAKCIVSIEIGRHTKNKSLDLVLETGEDSLLFVSEVKK